MKKISTKNLVLSGLFISLGLILPFLTAQVPSIGSKLLPMHLPVIICGFACGWQYGLVVGFIVPILRSILFGMPPMIPTALAMALELATYGCIAGVLFKLLPKKTEYIFMTLIASMICGRIVWGLVSLFLYGVGGTLFSWEMFIAGAFINALPGIVIQIVIIPMIVIALKKANYIQNV